VRGYQRVYMRKSLPKLADQESVRVMFLPVDDLQAILDTRFFGSDKAYCINVVGDNVASFPHCCIAKVTPSDRLVANHFTPDPGEST